VKPCLQATVRAIISPALDDILFELCDRVDVLIFFPQALEAKSVFAADEIGVLNFIVAVDEDDGPFEFAATCRPTRVSPCRRARRSARGDRPGDYANAWSTRSVDVGRDDKPASTSGSNKVDRLSSAIAASQFICRSCCLRFDLGFQAIQAFFEQPVLGSSTWLAFEEGWGRSPTNLCDLFGAFHRSDQQADFDGQQLNVVRLTLISPTMTRPCRGCVRGCLPGRWLDGLHNLLRHLNLHYMREPNGPRSRLSSSFSSPKTIFNSAFCFRAAGKPRRAVPPGCR